MFDTVKPPVSWSKALFTMSPKKVRAKQTSDFRPIANVRLLYKTFAYLLLGRLEDVLDAKPPAKQHGFRAGRPLEEHLLSANILWTNLFEQGIPQHLIRVLQRVCYGQHGEIVGDFGQNDQFPITGGVRQGCVLGPRLFSAVLELAMRKWRHAVGQAGIDLMDGGPHLIDLRFADDILFFARSRHELGQLMDSLNAEKTVVLTNEAQPPPFLATDSGLKLTILQRNVGQKRWGCILTAAGTQLQHIDLEYHLQQFFFTQTSWFFLTEVFPFPKA